MDRKGVIVVDMPKSCYECMLCHEKPFDCRYVYCGDKFCGVENEEVNEFYNKNSKPDWCPLIEIRHSDEFNNLMTGL